MSSNTNMEILVVGGGGQGSSNYSGGGGGGGMIVDSITLPESGYSVNITVGAGGANMIDDIGESGSDSAFGLYIAIGGGGGGLHNAASGTQAAKTGGSGGGGGGATSEEYPRVYSYGAGGIISQGNYGGNGVWDTTNTIKYRASGGGGGAGSAGTNGSSNGYGGNGGDAKQWLVDLQYYAAGGGGGTRRDGTPVDEQGGQGGYGGGVMLGGHGAPTTPGGSTADGTAGTPNTGSGGGGGPSSTSIGGADGVVKVWVPFHYVFDSSHFTNVTSNITGTSSILAYNGTSGTLVTFTGVGSATWTPGWSGIKTDSIEQFKVQDNAFGQSVWAVYNTTDSAWYNQPDLSFTSPNQYVFDVSDPSNSGYVLSFGSSLDISDATIESTYVTRSGTPGTDSAFVTLDLTNYSGDALVYFEESTTGMGYTGYTETYTVNSSAEYSWKQIGSDLDGEAAGDNFGDNVSLSSDGNVLAVGAKNNDGNGSNSGHVRVFEWNGNDWTQRGNDIDGEAASDQSSAVSLSSDGTILAVGAPGNDGGGNAGGHVRVYNWDGSSWTQIGSDIDEVLLSSSGSSVSLSSDGTFLAIGALVYDTDSINNTGSVRIVEWDGSSWTQRGSYINDDQEFAYGGSSVRLSFDGNIVVCASSRYDTVNGVDSGRVRVFEWNPSTSDWIQRGNDLNGDNAGDYYGSSVSLSSNGNILCIGGIANDTGAKNGGHSRVFEWNGSSWSQLGNDFYGTTKEGYNGFSTSLSSDGTIVAIGTSRSSESVGGLAGRASVYKWDGSTWNQFGENIIGESREDHSGYSVSLSSDGSRLAVGALFNDGTTGDTNDNRGHTRVYTLDISNNYDVAVAVANTFYVTVSGSLDTFYLDGSPNPTIDFSANSRYIFDQSDPSNDKNKIVFGFTYGDRSNILSSTDGVTLMGTAGQPGAYTQLDLSSGFVGPLYYYSIFSQADISYVVTIANGKYYLDGSPKPHVEFEANTTYYFDESDSSNYGSELIFGRTVDDVVNFLGSSDGVEVFGTAGYPGAYTKLVLSSSFTGVIYYYSAKNSGMGYAPTYNVPDATTVSNAISGDTAILSTISTDDLTDTTVVGEKDASKRNYTQNLLKQLVNNNSSVLSGKKLVLSGITLPGFTNTKGRETFVVTADTDSVLDNSLTKEEMINKNVYVLIENNEEFTLPTNNGSLVITKTGDTTYDASFSGVTTSYNSGDTFTDNNGLTVLFGSVYASLDREIINVDILLTHFLNESITSSGLAIQNFTQTVITSDATVTCVGPAATVLQNTFYFQTNNDIATSETDDVYYFVDTSKWSTMAADLNASTNGTISTADGAFIQGESISEYFLRHIANELFGTHLAVDLFNNETAVKSDIMSKTAIVAANIVTDISNVGITGTDSDLSGSSYNKFLTDDVITSKNVSRELMNQLLDNDSSRGRFLDLSGIEMTPGVPGTYKIPFLAGDTLSYKVTIRPNVNQDSDVPTGGTTSERSFRVKMVLQ